MRDAFGGEFTMRLLLVFVFIFVAFIAVSYNYAKAFKVKNSIIDYIEKNSITDISTISGELPTILEKLNYHRQCNSGDGAISGSGYCYSGVVFIEKNREDITDKDVKIATMITYEIKTYAEWNIGALNKILTFGGKKENSKDYVDGAFEIIGEATVIQKG